MKNIEDVDVHIVDEHRNKVGDQQNVKDAAKNPAEHTVYDLQNAIKKMTSLFPDNTCLTDGENEASKSGLKPIVEQMKTLGFAQSQRLSVLFYVLTRLVWKARRNLKLQFLSLQEIIDEVCKKVFFDDKAKDRRKAR